MTQQQRMAPVKVKGQGELGLTGDREDQEHWRAMEIGDQGDCGRGVR